MRLIYLLIAGLLGFVPAFGATVSYNTATGMLQQPTNFFPLHVLSEGASVVRYNIGTNTITLLVATNSASSPGVLPPYSVGALWINGQFRHLSNIIVAGSNVTMSVTESNVTISSTNAGTFLTVESVFLQRANIEDSSEVTVAAVGTNIVFGIPPYSVGLGKIQQINPETILGYGPGASASDVTRVTLGANLYWSGNTINANTSSSSNSWQIAVDGGLVIEPNLADGARVAVSASGTNVTYDLVSSSITSSYLATNGVTAGTFSNATVTVNDRGLVTTITSGAASGGGSGTNAFINGLLIQPLRITNNVSDTGRVVWYTNSNGDVLAYATNLPAGGSSGAGTNAFINGVLQQPVRLTNSTDTLWSDDGAGNWRLLVSTNRFYSLLTNSLIASNNISIAYDGGALKVMISAAASGGTGTAVTVDGGSDLVRLNLSDSATTGLFDLSGTNATFRLPDRDFGSVTVSGSGATITLDDGAVTTSKIANANVTIEKLGTTGTANPTNFLAGDFSWKQITTNMIPGLVADILSAATNGTAGGGHKIDVNGSHVPNPNLVNSSNLVWSVSGSDISAIVTNVPGSTTANVLQRIGGVLFYTSGGTNQSNESYFGVATNILVNNAGDGIPLQATVSLSGAPSTNYVVVIEPYDINSPFSGSSMAYSIRDKTTSGFQFTANYSGSDLGGVWYRIWVIDTVTVGGNGGDVVSTANNNFTATNNFAGPLNAATITVNDDAYGAGWNGSTNVPTKNAVYDKIESLALYGGVSTGSGTTFTPNFSASKSHEFTLTGTATLAAPTGVGTNMLGETFRLVFVQDSTGVRTLTLATNYLFGSDITGLTLTTNAGARDYVSVYVRRTNVLDVIGFVRNYIQ